MSKSSDEIIILSDDNDDGHNDEDVDEIRIESVVSLDEPKSRTISTAGPTMVLTEPKSITYGIERGYQLKKIHGLKRLPTNNMLMYLVEYQQCQDYEFVPSTILQKYCDEKMLVEYLEQLTQFKD